MGHQASAASAVSVSIDIARRRQACAATARPPGGGGTRQSGAREVFSRRGGLEPWTEGRGGGRQGASLGRLEEVCRETGLLLKRGEAGALA